LKDKGKRPMIEEEPITTCEICVQDNLLRSKCSKWALCSKCSRKGHVASHCQARWAKIGKFFSQSGVLGSWPNLDGASTCKDPNPLVISENMNLSGDTSYAFPQLGPPSSKQK
jgi:hypothetical protein